MIISIWDDLRLFTPKFLVYMSVLVHILLSEGSIDRTRKKIVRNRVEKMLRSPPSLEKATFSFNLRISFLILY